MSNLLSAQFWFNQYPGTLISSSVRLLLGLIILFLLAAAASLILYLRKDFYRPLWYKTMNFFAFNAVVGFALFFFSEQLVPFFSTRIWFAIWAVLMLVWAIIVINFAKKLPEKKRRLTEEKAYQKYIP